MAVPQLILFLSPQGELYAEEPGVNGARRRVTLDSGFELSQIRASLYDQRDHILAREARDKRLADAEAKAKSERVFAKTLRAHGPDLAQRVNAELMANLRSAKSQKARQAIAGSDFYFDLMSKLN